MTSGLEMEWDYSEREIRNMAPLCSSSELRERLGIDDIMAVIQ